MSGRPGTRRYWTRNRNRRAYSALRSAISGAVSREEIAAMIFDVMAGSRPTDAAATLNTFILFRRGILISPLFDFTFVDADNLNFLQGIDLRILGAKIRALHQGSNEGS